MQKIKIMNTRFKMGKVYPAAYKAMDGLDNLIENSLVDKWYREMIRIKASQINGCAYCVNYHTGDALKLGVDFKKINLISAWREATNVFNEEEQLLLQMTEELTLIHRHGLSDAAYQKTLELFGEERTAHTIMLIITINAWNRIGVGLKMQPEL
jgi:AhpD family alkylhydroperoxidase